METLKYLKNMSDTKKCFRQKLYGIEGDILCFYLFDLETSCKSDVKIFRWIPLFFITFTLFLLSFIILVVVIQINFFQNITNSYFFAPSTIEI